MGSRLSRITSKGDDRISTVARYLNDIEGTKPTESVRRKRSISRVSLARQPSASTNGQHTATLLGETDWDLPEAANEVVYLRAPWDARGSLRRDMLVRILDEGDRVFLGRVVSGPFFPSQDEGTANGKCIRASLELLGVLAENRVIAATTRPAPGSKVYAMAPEQAAELLGSRGGMVLGRSMTEAGMLLRLDPRNKSVLPRNLGVFGTVGAGKSNTTQVLIEEAARNGWAVILLDVEGEYLEMDAPGPAAAGPLLSAFGRAPEGLPDFRVFCPASTASDRKGAHVFTLRLADFEPEVIAELVDATAAERNSLLDTIEHLQTRAKNKLETREAAGVQTLLDPTPKAKLPYQITTVLARLRERGPQSNDQFDHLGLSSKLAQLHRAEIMDQGAMNALDVLELVKPGRVSIVDVSQANDLVRNLVTADLLRKLFAYKLLMEEAAPTLLVLEEAHSFINKERSKTMQATMQMLRTVARRGRKRWLSLAFISQQPGHLPAEIFELCNTRIVHTVRSLHNLEALMASAGDVNESQWARCPLLGPGEALVSSPQLSRPFVATIRPAATKRRFTG